MINFEDKNLIKSIGSDTFYISGVFNSLYKLVNDFEETIDLFKNTDITKRYGYDTAKFIKMVNSFDDLLLSENDEKINKRTLPKIIVTKYVNLDGNSRNHVTMFSRSEESVLNEFKEYFPDYLEPLLIECLYDELKSGYHTKEEEFAMLKYMLDLQDKYSLYDNEYKIPDYIFKARWSSTSERITLINMACYILDRCDNKYEKINSSIKAFAELLTYESFSKKSEREAIIPNITSKYQFNNLLELCNKYGRKNSYDKKATCHNKVRLWQKSIVDISI